METIFMLLTQVQHVFLQLTSYISHCKDETKFHGGGFHIKKPLSKVYNKSLKLQMDLYVLEEAYWLPRSGSHTKSHVIGQTDPWHTCC